MTMSCTAPLVSVSAAPFLCLAWERPPLPCSHTLKPEVEVGSQFSVPWDLGTRERSVWLKQLCFGSQEIMSCGGLESSSCGSCSAQYGGWRVHFQGKTLCAQYCPSFLLPRCPGPQQALRDAQGSSETRSPSGCMASEQGQPSPPGQGSMEGISAVSPQKQLLHASTPQGREGPCPQVSAGFGSH